MPAPPPAPAPEPEPAPAPAPEAAPESGGRGLFGMGRRGKGDQKAAPNSPATLQVVVADLPDERDRRAFRGALAGARGVRSAKLSAGPGEDCTVVVVVDAGLDIADVLMKLPGFVASIRDRSADGVVVSVGPEDPFQGF